jgi:hypothetical protein
MKTQCKFPGCRAVSETPAIAGWSYCSWPRPGRYCPVHSEAIEAEIMETLDDDPSDTGAGAA